LSQVKVKFLADTSNMKNGAKDASKAIQSITKAVLPGSSAIGSMGNSLLSAFSPQNLASGPLAAAAAIGAVAGMATKAFDIMMEASKAYFVDAQSVQQLDIALINNTKATDAQIHAIESQINSLSMLTAIQDDKLRKSYANIVAATKDSTASMKLLKIATDVSAGSGLDLDKVSKALTKAYEGNSGALQKLLPGVKKGRDGINELADAYKGAGQAVGDKSPFERIQLAMQNLQEILGMELAPLIEQFAAWLASDDFQKFMDTLTASAIKMAQALSDAVQPIFDMLDAINNPTFQWFVNAGNKISPVNGGIWGIFKPDADATKSNDFVKSLTGSLGDLRNQLKGLKGFKFKPADVVPKPAEIAQRIKDATKTIQEAGKNFAAALKFDDYLNKDTGMFDANAFMDKFRRIVDAAKALPAKLRALRKAGASPEVLQQIVAMGPEQGLAVAQGFLSNAGSAAEYSKSLTTLNTLGQQSAAVGMSTNKYEININKANMTAEEIIAAIQKYERKTGKKVTWNNG
jgi:hypothetical protein